MFRLRCIYLSPTAREKATSRKPLKVQLNGEIVRNIYQEKLEELVYHESDIHPEATWHDIQTAVEAAVISNSNLNQKVGKNQ